MVCPPISILYKKGAHLITKYMVYKKSPLISFSISQFHTYLFLTSLSISLRLTLHFLQHFYKTSFTCDTSSIKNNLISNHICILLYRMIKNYCSKQAFVIHHTSFTNTNITKQFDCYPPQDSVAHDIQKCTLRNSKMARSNLIVLHTKCLQYLNQKSYPNYFYS